MSDGQNGKGSAPRNCFSKDFKDHFDDIDWSKRWLKSDIEKLGCSPEKWLDAGLSLKDYKEWKKDGVLPKRK